MLPLSSLGIGLSLVSGSLFLALVAELYYLLWWRKRARGDIHGDSKDLLHLFCWKKPSSLRTTALNPREMSTSADSAAAYSRTEHHLLKPFDGGGGGGGGGGGDTLETELMRLHGLGGPPRLLFTIEEETKEDLEIAEGKSAGKSSSSSPPFFTTRSTPHKLQIGRPNQLLKSQEREEEELIKMWPSPPPMLKFLQDAEEKHLRRKKLTEEGRTKAGRTEDDGPPLIAIVMGKSRDRAQQQLHSSSSQVIPLPLPSSLSGSRPVTPHGNTN